KRAAQVYRDTSAVVSKTPKAPAPLACGCRSGTFSRLKCAICSRKCTSCSRMGPSGPIVREFRSLTAGAPEPVVERGADAGLVSLIEGLLRNAFPNWLGLERAPHSEGATEQLPTTISYPRRNVSDISQLSRDVGLAVHAD